MKAQFLKMGGCKTEKEFYNKFPTKEAFFNAHPEALNVMRMGGLIKAQPGGRPLESDYPDYESWAAALEEYANGSLPQIPVVGALTPEEIAQISSQQIPVQQQVVQPSSTGYNGPSIVDFLASVGKSSDYRTRKKLAEELGFNGYRGTASQNEDMLAMLQQHPELYEDLQDIGNSRPGKKPVIIPEESEEGMLNWSTGGKDPSMLNWNFPDMYNKSTKKLVGTVPQWMKDKVWENARQTSQFKNTTDTLESSKTALKPLPNKNNSDDSAVKTLSTVLGVAATMLAGGLITKHEYDKLKTTLPTLDKASLRILNSNKPDLAIQNILKLAKQQGRTATTLQDLMKAGNLSQKEALAQLKGIPFEETMKKQAATTAQNQFLDTHTKALQNSITAYEKQGGKELAKNMKRVNTIVSKMRYHNVRDPLLMDELKTLIPNSAERMSLLKGIAAVSKSIKKDGGETYSGNLFYDIGGMYSPFEFEHGGEMSNFRTPVSKWNFQSGGEINVGDELEIDPDELQNLIDQGYNFEVI